MIRPVRDTRIDFFRGLALWMIFTDHISGNFLRHFTYRVFGFSDAADIFVFVSGISSCLLYYRLIVEEGFKGAQLRAFRRVAQIYFGYLCVVAATFLLTLATRYVYDDGYEWVLANPGAAFAEAVILDFAPGLNSVLPLYMVLIDGGAHFRSSDVVRGLCWVIVAANLAFGLAAHSGKIIGEVPLLAQMNEFWNAVKGDNTAEHWLRLSHFLAVAYLVASYVPAQTAILKMKWCQPILLCGRFSLQSYCFGAVLSLASSIYLEMGSPGLTVQVLINLLGWSLMTALAVLLAWMRRSRNALSRPRAISLRQ
ncbi:MAG TPA: OpgC domain-containing protein [Stellaceae bacterium]|nr:OpgC domain-containing protein [Stellaceae bacterium]